MASNGMIELSAILGALVIGFVAGYSVRAMVSRMRRQRWLRDQGWQS
jgi:fructose-specific phosphotransferase system IIC component